MKTGPGDVLTCLFCGKNQHQVFKLVAGPGVYICEDCVDLAHTIVEEERARQPPS